MTREIPSPLRAAAGLAATALDEARRLPERLASLPVLALSTAMQTSMKVQQHYAELVGRGDQLLSDLSRGEERPSWARFDEDESGEGDYPPAATDVRWSYGEEDSYGEKDSYGEEDLEVPGSDAIPADGDGAGDGANPAGADAEAAPVPDGPPQLPTYSGLSLAQLRGRLRSLTAVDVQALIEYEEAHANRAPFLTMLHNRLARLAHG